MTGRDPLRSPRAGASVLVEAQIDAESGSIRIDTTAPEDLQVLLDEELIEFEDGVTLILSDGEPRSVTPSRNLEVIVRTGRWGDPDLTFEAAIDVSP